MKKLGTCSHVENNPEQSKDCCIIDVDLQNIAPNNEWQSNKVQLHSCITQQELASGNQRKYALVYRVGGEEKSKIDGKEKNPIGMYIGIGRFPSPAPQRKPPHSCSSF